MKEFDIYEGRTEQNRKKTYLVFNADRFSFNEATAEATHYFKCTKKNVKTRPAWVNRGNLYLEADTKPAKSAKCVIVSFWKK